MVEKRPVAPQWAGRVPKWKIARIYEDDAIGIHDEDLLSEVAYTLWIRCKSMLMVEEARNGRATCPVCETVIEHSAGKRTVLDCQNCDWTGSWEGYRASFKGLHIIAPGLQPFCREFVMHLPLAQTPKEKMYWIDWLIHRCHWEGTALPGQPGATSLIQGRAQDVNAFLDHLSAGTYQPKMIGDLRQYWSPVQKEQIWKWRQTSERRKSRRNSTNQESG